jgi:hypothetical protein
MYGAGKAAAGEALALLLSGEAKSQANRREGGGKCLRGAVCPSAFERRQWYNITNGLGGCQCLSHERLRLQPMRTNNSCTAEWHTVAQSRGVTAGQECVCVHATPGLGNRRSIL